MNCKNCGQEAWKQKSGKLNQYCFQEWFRTCDSRPNINEVAPVTIAERQYRAELFQQAKEGDPAAREIMKIKYGITAFWDGKEVAKL